MDRILKISIVIIIIGIAAYFGYKLFSSWHSQSLESAKEQERVEWEKRTRDLMDKVSGLQEELSSLKGESISKQKLEAVFGPQPAAVKEEKTFSFKEIEEQIKAFFTYLDDQGYVKEYKLQGGTYKEFQQALKKLSANLPDTTGETISLYNLYRNMAHFFRVLGKTRVHLIKDILQNEKEIMESAMQTFYLWAAYETDDRASSGQPSLQTMYEYSGFFLNTLAGRSYLLRRDSKIRMLTVYYAVRILDKANDEQLNSYGLDIRPHIQSLLNDLQTQTGLIHQKQYVSELEKLAVKYKLSQ